MICRNCGRETPTGHVFCERPSQEARAYALYRRANPEGFADWSMVEGKDYWLAKAGGQ
jgi:hypothetical protein